MDVMGEEPGANRTLPVVVKKVHTFFRKRGYTLSVAESCTGGLISHLITSLPGASAFFEAGVVSYSANAKKSILKVSSRCMRRYGVVSAETAREMAEKIRVLTGTDFSVSTTGNLGPDVLEGKERGLVFIGVSTGKETRVKTLRLRGGREENKERAAISAIGFLLDTALRENSERNEPLK